MPVLSRIDNLVVSNCRWQVIFLDSDNVAVADVQPLFLSPEYKEHGAMLWPDYWASLAAPDLQAILGLRKMGGATTWSSIRASELLLCFTQCSKYPRVLLRYSVVTWIQDRCPP